MNRICWSTTNFLLLLYFALPEQISDAFLLGFSTSRHHLPCPVSLSKFQIDWIRSELRDCLSLKDGDTRDFNKTRSIQSRRDALSLLVWSYLSGPAAAAAVNINNDSEYTPSTRATAYFVDSTIPPTLVPYRKQREAAILKSLGNGYGTIKETSLLDTTVNLNNIMNKTISGIYDRLFSSKKTGQPLDSSFVFFGMDFESKDDVQLAIKLSEEILKPRRRQLPSNTAIGLSWAPQSTQVSFDTFFQSSTVDNASIDKLKAALLEAKVPIFVISCQLPLLLWARAIRLPIIALAPQDSDLVTVRKNGLQDLDIESRATYVADTKGFVDMVQNPKFKLYTERSLLKEYNANAAKNDNLGNFFAERILNDEAIATASAKWALLANSRSATKNNNLMIILSAFEGVRFLGGANGRVLRVFQFLSPDATIGEEAVTTILLNPTAQVSFLYTLLIIIYCSNAVPIIV